MARNWWESPNAFKPNLMHVEVPEKPKPPMYQPSGIGPPQKHPVYGKGKRANRWEPAPGFLWKDPKTGKVHVTVWRRIGAGRGSGSMYYDEQYVPRELAWEKAQEYKEALERERLKNQRRNVYTLPPVQKF